MNRFKWSKTMVKRWSVLLVAFLIVLMKIVPLDAVLFVSLDEFHFGFCLHLPCDCSLTMFSDLKQTLIFQYQKSTWAEFWMPNYSNWRAARCLNWRISRTPGGLKTASWNISDGSETVRLLFNFIYLFVERASISRIRLACYQCWALPDRLIQY